MYTHCVSHREAKQFDWEDVHKQLQRDGGTCLVDVQPGGRWSALHQAVYGDSVKMVTMLMRCFANLNVLTRDGKTPLDRMRMHCQS
jgi:hypothetical protein